MGIKITAEPTEEPVTIEQAKLHLGVYGAFDDANITALITAARQSVEAYTRRALCTQTVALTMDSFAAVIELPMLPVQLINSIQYVDESGNNQTYTAYQVDLSGSYSARIQPEYNSAYPATRAQMGAVVISFDAGYGNAAAVPFPIKQAILLMVGSMYANRENEAVGVSVSDLPINIQYLLNPYQLSLV